MAKKLWRNALGEIIRLPGDTTLMRDEDCCCGATCEDHVECMNTGQEPFYTGMNLEVEGLENGGWTEADTRTVSCSYDNLNRPYSLDFTPPDFTLLLAGDSNCDTALGNKGILIAVEERLDDPDITFEWYAYSITANIACDSSGPSDKLYLAGVSWGIHSYSLVGGVYMNCTNNSGMPHSGGAGLGLAFDDFQGASFGKCFSDEMTSSGTACKCGPALGSGSGCEDESDATATATVF